MTRPLHPDFLPTAKQVAQAKQMLARMDMAIALDTVFSAHLTTLRKRLARYLATHDSKLLAMLVAEEGDAIENALSAAEGSVQPRMKDAA